MSTSSLDHELHAPRPWRRLLADVLVLAKVRITLMVLISTAAGYALASNVVVWQHMAQVLLATGLISAGINALNQYVERDLDKRMRRTALRPLPAGRMTPMPVLWGGVVATLAGIALLGYWANALTAGLGVLVAVTYVLCYTPLKTRTNLATLVGAVPGALPPVVGWAAASGVIGPEAWALFLILFFWQMPHFLAIAWLCREEYANAGMPMLSVSDPGGLRTKRQTLLYTAVLVPVSLYPAVLGMAGPVYFVTALIAGVGFLATAAYMAARMTNHSAVVVLKASVLYLPLVLALLLLDATPL